MTRRSWIQFAFLAAFWGASYLFIKVALEDVFSPPVIVFCARRWPRWCWCRSRSRSGALARCAAAGARSPCWPCCRWRRRSCSSPSASSTSPRRSPGILVATAPIFTFLLAIWLSREERAQGIGAGGRGARDRRRGAAARHRRRRRRGRARRRPDGGAGQPRLRARRLLPQAQARPACGRSTVVAATMARQRADGARRWPRSTCRRRRRRSTRWARSPRSGCSAPASRSFSSTT